MSVAFRTEMICRAVTVRRVGDVSSAAVTRNPGMKPRWFKVVGNHAVNGVQPGMKFEAVIEDDHPWVVGGHVAVTRPSRVEEETAEELAADGGE